MSEQLTLISAATAAAVLLGTSAFALRRPEPWVVLQLDVRQGQVNHKAVDRLYHSLWGVLRRGWWLTWRKGPGRFSFEFTVAGDKIRFHVAVPASQAKSITRQLQVTYPGLLVAEIEDPLTTWALRPGLRAAAALVVTQRSSAYPLEFDGASPVQYLRGTLPPLPDGEEVWIQVLLRPTAEVLKQRVGIDGPTDRVSGRLTRGLEELQTGFMETVQQAGFNLGGKGGGAVAKSQQPSQQKSTAMPWMTLERRHQMAAAEKRHAGRGFATVIRVVAVASTAGRARSLIREATAALCWPAGPNSLQARRCWFTGKALQRFTQRWGPTYWWKRCILSPEELTPLAQVVPPPEAAQGGARIIPVEEDLT